MHTDETIGLNPGGGDLLIYDKAVVILSHQTLYVFQLSENAVPFPFRVSRAEREKFRIIYFHCSIVFFIALDPIPR